MRNVACIDACVIRAVAAMEGIARVTAGNRIWSDALPKVAHCPAIKASNVYIRVSEGGGWKSEDNLPLMGSQSSIPKKIICSTNPDTKTGIPAAATAENIAKVLIPLNLPVPVSTPIGTPTRTTINIDAKPSSSVAGK